MTVAIERKHGRIYFDYGTRDEWSVIDPDAPDHQYTQRSMATEWNYMISMCPTTKLALEKVRLIRRALATVPSPYETEE